MCTSSGFRLTGACLPLLAVRINRAMEDCGHQHVLEYIMSPSRAEKARMSQHGTTVTSIIEASHFANPASALFAGIGGCNAR